MPEDSLLSTKCGDLRSQPSLFFPKLSLKMVNETMTDLPLSISLATEPENDIADVVTASNTNQKTPTDVKTPTDMKTQSDFLSNSQCDFIPLLNSDPRHLDNCSSSTCSQSIKEDNPVNRTVKLQELKENINIDNIPSQNKWKISYVSESKLVGTDAKNCLMFKGSFEKVVDKVASIYNVREDMKRSNLGQLLKEINILDTKFVKEDIAKEKSFNVVKRLVYRYFLYCKGLPDNEDNTPEYLPDGLRTLWAPLNNSALPYLFEKYDTFKGEWFTDIEGQYDKTCLDEPSDDIYIPSIADMRGNVESSYSHLTDPSCSRGKLVTSW